MPGGIGIPQGIVADIAVAIEGLGIARRRDNRIRLQEPPQTRIIVPGVVEIEPRRIQPLPGELLGNVSRPLSSTQTPIRGVLGQLHELPRAIRHDIAAAEVIPVVEALSKSGESNRTAGLGERQGSRECVIARPDPQLLLFTASP